MAAARTTQSSGVAGNPMDAFILRLGRHWGNASVAWARRRLSYRGPIRPLVRRPDCEVWVQGEPATHRTADGVEVLGLEFEPRCGLSIEDVYVNGAFRDDAADIWNQSIFLAVDAARGRVELLSGQYCPLGCFYGHREASLFVAPELKAFSNLHSLKSIRSMPSGYHLCAALGRGELELRSLRGLPGPAMTALGYEEAVRRCRQLMEEALDRTLATVREPLALSLSGGIDSSILTYMLARRGVRFRAFNAWFEAENREAPADVSHARLVARHLGFRLEEVRVDRASLLSYLPESIYFGERETVQLIDNSLYYLPLLDAMRDAGLRIRICGDGPDTYFSGFEQFSECMDPAAFRNLYFTLLRDGHARHIPALHASRGFGLLEPFCRRELLDFALTLPQDYMTLRRGDRFYGKRIIRDAFRGDVPEFILERRKGLPGDVNDAWNLTAQIFGGYHEKYLAYRSIRRRLLAPPRLGAIPAWIVRTGLLERRMRLGLASTTPSPERGGPRAGNSGRDRRLRLR